MGLQSSEWEEMSKTPNSNHLRKQRIVIANGKGGCGKTTIATNIAAYYATQTQQPILFDYDCQGSSMLWLRQRPEQAAKVIATSAHKSASNAMTKAWQLRIPAEVEKIVLDTPAGLYGFALSDLIRHADVILVPVLPSPIDMDAASMFIEKLRKVSKVVNPKVKIAVLANRVRQQTNSFFALDKFLKELDIPFVGSLRDTQNYAKASLLGLGVHELKSVSSQKDILQWRSIFEWIDFCHNPVSLPAEARVVNCA